MALPGFDKMWDPTVLGTVAAMGLIGAASAYFLIIGKRRRPSSKAFSKQLTQPPEPPPEHAPNGGVSEPDWESLLQRLASLEDHRRQHDLHVLRRIYAACKSNDEPASVNLEKVCWTVEQEAMRLLQQAEMDEKVHREDDVLSHAAKLVQWALQKTPELAQLDMSDVILAKTVADINRLKTDISTIVVDLNELKAIHNVDRDTALEKTKKRAESVKKALPLLQANGMVLSEALIASKEELKSFESITGFQVVSLGPSQGYVTFEGNGRAWALKQAFGPEDDVKVEVRLFHFGDALSGSLSQKIIRRVNRVREWKKVTDEWPEQV